jgi:chaperonin cofactor prefoldin
MQYSNFKDTLQNIASQIGNVEQEVEEHKYVMKTFNVLCFHDSCEVLSIWKS